MARLQLLRWRKSAGAAVDSDWLWWLPKPGLLLQKSCWSTLDGDFGSASAQQTSDLVYSVQTFANIDNSLVSFVCQVLTDLHTNSTIMLAPVGQAVPDTPHVSLLTKNESFG